VGSHLVTFGDHALDQIWVGSCGVDFTFSIIIASDEERSVETVYFEYVEELSSVVVWSIIIRQRNDVVLDTIVDIVCVGDGTLQGTGHILS
jgi:hypothetical protein